MPPSHLYSISRAASAGSLGAPLARLECKVTVQEFMRRIPEFEPNGEPLWAQSYGGDGFDQPLGLTAGIDFTSYSEVVPDNVTGNERQLWLKRPFDLPGAMVAGMPRAGSFVAPLTALALVACDRAQPPERVVLAGASPLVAVTLRKIGTARNGSSTAVSVTRKRR